MTTPTHPTGAPARSPTARALAWFARRRSTVVVLVAVVAPLPLAAAFVPFRQSLTTVAAAFAFVVLEVVVSVLGSRLAGALVSLSSALWFDYFLAPPYGRLAISHRPDLEAAIGLFVVGVVVSELAARNRHHRRTSSEESDFVSMVHELATLAAGPAPMDDVIAHACASLREVLSLRACRFESGPLGPALARIVSNGEVEHVGLQWPVGEIGIPGPEAELPVQWRGRVAGRFVVTPTPGLSVSLERRVVAVVLGEIVAAAVDHREWVHS